MVEVNPKIVDDSKEYGSVKSISREEYLDVSNQFLSPARRGIKGGTVKAMKDKFDGHSKRNIAEKKPDLLRLKKSCLKPPTPGKSKKRGHGRISSKKAVFDSKQSKIEDFFRGQGDRGDTLDNH